MRLSKRIGTTCVLVLTCLATSSCAWWESTVHDLRGSIAGCTYNASFYTNNGECFMTTSGKRIDFSSNPIDELTYDSEGNVGHHKTLSSVLTITIDGHQMESCGTTAVFAEEGLEPDVEFTGVDNITSDSNGKLSDMTSIASLINGVKNKFGKPQIVVIQSQFGDPICAYSGDSVYWDVVENLPKTTKLMVDGKALYVHRANFQIIDKALLK